MRGGLRRMQGGPERMRGGGKGRCELSNHTGAAYPTVRRCPTPPPPRKRPPRRPSQNPPSQNPPPPPGASGRQSVGGVVGVQN